MPNLGTFKPTCKWSHPRENNVDATGHCRTCLKERHDPVSAARAKEKRLTFKPLCLRGHERRDNVDSKGHCKTCRKEYWGKNTPREQARDRVWKHHGMKNADGTPFTMSDYNCLFTTQAGMCLGCTKHQSELTRVLLVDHDHETGIVRGLLCSGCNVAIGHTKDNPATLERLANYLRRGK
jgi:hypothetical protein